MFAIHRFGPHDIVVDLNALAARTVSFTFPDSMISFGLAFRMREGEEHEPRPYDRSVFGRAGLTSVTET